VSNLARLKLERRLARVELLNRSAKFGALVNRRFGTVKQDVYEAVSDEVVDAARKFVRAEEAYKQAEREAAGELQPIRGPRPVNGGPQ
jgi:hypothetical protein